MKNGGNNIICVNLAVSEKKPVKQGAILGSSDNKDYDVEQDNRCCCRRQGQFFAFNTNWDEIDKIESGVQKKDQIKHDHKTLFEFQGHEGNHGGKQKEYDGDKKQPGHHLED